MGGPWLLDAPTLGPRTAQGIRHQVQCIDGMSDDELRAWLEERGQDASGPRPALVDAGHWRGLGKVGDTEFKEKGVVLPEAIAWIERVGREQAAAEKLRA